MDEQSLQSDQNIEYHLVTMFEKLENLRNGTVKATKISKLPVKVEIRTLEFWRAVISECLSSFIYVFVVCGAAAGSGVGAPISSVLLATALSAGFAMTSLTQCFGHISGAHINPAVSIAMGVIKRISILRAVLFIIAQCGGGIAGAAFLYGVTVPGYQGNLSAAIGHSAAIAPWERFGIEFMLTFIVVFSYFISMDTYRKWTGTSSLTIGSTYSACSFVSMPYLNPARSLGPSFVLNKWNNHWVYWLGPMCGGIVSGLIYEYIFNPRRQRKIKDVQDEESSSIRSDDIDTFDDIDKPAPPKFHGSNYNNFRAPIGATASNYCGSLYSAPATKIERGESIYGGTKSLYCNSPPLTRANLNRSQSVYAKSNSGIHKDLLPRAGPLVPAQSMYPLRINQHNHVNNQNVQNQLQQRTEGVYGVRGITPGTANRPETHGTTERQKENYSTAERQRCDNYSTAERQRRENHIVENPYGTRGTPSASETTENKPSRGNRPESMYGVLGSQTRRGQSSIQSDDSCYSSYTANSSTRNNYGGNNNGNFHNAQKPNSLGYSGRTCVGGGGATSSDSRANQSTQILVNGSNPSSYHHQHSPNPQY
ncbi:neurogenic protein big brain isoform X1 [Diorhabda sublineata]|uniref:neurogenic protein big brain isoform X1 n=2 Tax=Diorhabda sublineata TaxID=1163346 RepID=UPI0024E14A70|nr:neurogenic protein big brain isoform X1 [Diorhabda sublineata]